MASTDWAVEISHEELVMAIDKQIENYTKKLKETRKALAEIDDQPGSGYLILKLEENDYCNKIDDLRTYRSMQYRWKKARWLNFDYFQYFGLSDND